MKKEDISDAVGKVKDEYISSANELRTKTRKKSHRGVIATACATVVLCTAGAVGLSQLSKPTTGNSSDKPAQKVTDKGFEIAVYKDKKTAKYPDFEEYTNQTDKESEKWWDERENRLKAVDDAVDKTAPFYKKLMTELLSRSDSTEENTVYSPTNLYMAMSVLAHTTEGDSRQEILDMLSADSLDDVTSTARNIFTSCTVDDGQSKTLLANSLWLDDRISYDKNKLKNIAKDCFASSYHGKSGTEEYNKVLRKWIDDHTGNLLGDMTKDIKLPAENLLTIASTIYFKGSWQDEFHKESNYMDKFTVNDTEKECEFMYRSDNMEYYKGKSFSAVSVPFRNEGKMWLILPDEGTRISELAKGDEINEVISGKAKTESKQVRLSVPKFDVSADLDLIKSFKNLGLSRIFTPDNSNVSGIMQDGDTYEAFVGQIQHGARVKIDEEGCEGAAFTMIMTLDGAIAMPEEPIIFKLDRPFIFTVSSSTNLPLFTGVVNDPT